MKRKKIIYCLIVAMLMLNISLFAIGDPPDPNKPPPPHPELPIDGGITYLLFAGVAFGLYQIKKKGV